MKILDMWLTLKRPNTVRSYRCVLERWTTYRGMKEMTMETFKAKPEECLCYLSELKQARAPDDRPLADATVAHHRRVLTAATQVLVDLQRLAKNPWLAVKHMLLSNQKVQKYPTGFVPFELVIPIIESPDQVTRKGIRDSALLATLFFCGLRRSEAQALTVQDVKIAPDGSLYFDIRGAKAGENQTQPIPEPAWEYISPLVASRKAEIEQHGHSDSAGLFINYFADQRPGKQISVETIYRIFKRYTALFGLNLSPHSARATAITYLLHHGYTFEDAAKFARHSSTVSTQVYDKRYQALSYKPGAAIDYTRLKDEK